jgi:putative acetyltransferase
MDPHHHRALDRRAETAQLALERPDSADAVALVTELEAHLAARYPAESRHGYSVEKLIRQGVAFFVARVDGAAAACGGVQIYGTEYAELKRMYVRPQFRGLGLGRRLLEELAGHARERGVHLLRLDTGLHQAEAIGLYEGFGFRRRPPFGEYRDDPLSVFYEKELP